MARNNHYAQMVSSEDRIIRALVPRSSFVGDDSWFRGPETSPVSHKTSHDIVPSEATTCDERARRTASRYIRHSRRSVKLAPPATLPKSGFPLPRHSDSSHRFRVFNAFIIWDLMTPGLSSRLEFIENWTFVNMEEETLSGTENCNIVFDKKIASWSIMPV